LTAPTLFQSPLAVITAGLSGFTGSLQRQDVPVVALDWRPPADGNEALTAILTAVYADPALLEKIEAANREVLSRISDSTPQIVDVLPAHEALGLEGQIITHAGPPVAWQRMCGPQKRAVMGAIQFEGWAASNAEAAALVQSGAVRLAPNHAHYAVGPMTGIISPSMPVLVAHNATFGNYGYSTFNEGRGNTLWFGLFDDGALQRLQWIRDTLAPAVKAALGQHGSLNVFDIVAQGLQMGDECHARSAACTALLIKRLTAPMLEAGVSPAAVAEFVRFADGNNHFFLTWTMAAVKCVMDAAHGVPYSTVVTAMSRNGVDFMLRVSGLGNEWLVAPVAPMDEAVYYTGFSVAEAAGDIGDSAIIETCGLGGMAMAGAPTIAAFVGGTLADEVAAVDSLADITVGRHPKFSLPPMDGQNTPLGVEVLRAVETRTVPFITTGVLHEASPTVGQIGTGVARVPISLFDAALIALAHTWGIATAQPHPTNTVRLEPS